MSVGRRAWFDRSFGDSSNGDSSARKWALGSREFDTIMRRYYSFGPRFTFAPTVPRRLQQCHLQSATMKRYQKLLGPISLGMCAWGVGLAYCSKNGECGNPLREIIESVSAALIAVSTERLARSQL